MKERIVAVHKNGFMYEAYYDDFPVLGVDFDYGDAGLATEIYLGDYD